VIGTSDGRQFQDEFDMLTQSGKPQQTDQPVIGSSAAQGSETPIDQDHHVPLVASAIMKPDGSYGGLAIDHRLNVPEDDKKLLDLHESTELPYMQDLMKGGAKPADAYAEAHKWATARETAASIAKWGTDGHEAYKERMRENAKVAAEPSDRERHPDAHTTKYGLDESELGYKKVAMEPFEPIEGLATEGSPMVRILGRGGSQGALAEKDYPDITPHPVNDNSATAAAADKALLAHRYEEMRSRLLPPRTKQIPSEVMGSLRRLGHLGFDRPADALNALREDKMMGVDSKKNWDIKPEDELDYQRIQKYLDKPFE
jgi:hypothetical protein